MLYYLNLALFTKDYLCRVASFGPLNIENLSYM